MSPPLCGFSEARLFTLSEFPDPPWRDGMKHQMKILSFVMAGKAAEPPVPFRRKLPQA